VDYYATLALRVLPTITYCYKFVDMQARWSTVQYYCYKKNLKLILKTVFRNSGYMVLYDAYSKSIVAVDSRKFMVVYSIRVTKFIILDYEKRSVLKVKWRITFFVACNYDTRGYSSVPGT